MLAAILALGLHLPFMDAAPACPPAVYVSCPDSRKLARNAGFQAALYRFTGDAHGAFLHGDKPLYGQVIQLISRPTQPVQELGGGARLFAGCKFLACPEKAAVIVDRYGVLAIGIIDYGDSSDPDLDIIVRRPDAGTQMRTAALKSWADAAVAKDSDSLHTRMKVRRVNVRALDYDRDPPTPQRRRWLPAMPKIPSL